MGKGQDEVVSLVRKFLGGIKNINLDKVILFGSYARNEQHEGSDVDLLIVSDDFKGTKSFKRGGEFYLNWDYDMDVDFICLTNEELEARRGGFGVVGQALREGMEI